MDGWVGDPSEPALPAAAPVHSSGTCSRHHFSKVNTSWVRVGRDVRAARAPSPPPPLACPRGRAGQWGCGWRGTVQPCDGSGWPESAGEVKVSHGRGGRVQPLGVAGAPGTDRDAQVALGTGLIKPNSTRAMDHCFPDRLPRSPDFPFGFCTTPGHTPRLDRDSGSSSRVSPRGAHWEPLSAVPGARGARCPWHCRSRARGVGAGAGGVPPSLGGRP